MHSGALLRFAPLAFRPGGALEATRDVQRPWFDGCAVPVVAWAPGAPSMEAALTHLAARLWALRAAGAMGNASLLVVGTPPGWWGGRLGWPCSLPPAGCRAQGHGGKCLASGLTYRQRLPVAVLSARVSPVSAAVAAPGGAAKAGAPLVASAAAGERLPPAVRYLLQPFTPHPISTFAEVGTAGKQVPCMGFCAAAAAAVTPASVPAVPSHADLTTDKSRHGTVACGFPPAAVQLSARTPRAFGQMGRCFQRAYLCAFRAAPADPASAYQAMQAVQAHYSAADGSPAVLTNPLRFDARRGLFKARGRGAALRGVRSCAVHVLLPRHSPQAGTPCPRLLRALPPAHG